MDQRQQHQQQQQRRQVGHIWTSRKDEVIAQYYSFRDGFICPTCMTWEPVSFAQFKVAHSSHAGDFVDSKPTTFSNCSGISSSSITINTSYPQQQQQPTTTTMPRKRKVRKQINFHHVTSDLNRSHKSVEVTFTETENSLIDIIHRHGDDIIRKLEDVDPTHQFKVQMFALCKFERKVGDVMEYKEWYVSICAALATGNREFLEK